MKPCACCLIVSSAVILLATLAPASEKPPFPGGQLQIVGPDGQGPGVCPLKYTDVKADIAGYVARVSVKQVFHNPTDKKIEAVYVFPLPASAAVDDMVMTVGERRILGQIKERQEARAIYEAAKAAGHVASLLDQERPNIFTQSVANIEPGVEVTIEISYVETLKYEDGTFEWTFPMVVGPRYIPGGGSAPAPMTNGRDTPQAPDGSKITPPVTLKGTRAGHDISLTVNIDGGMKLADLRSMLHEIAVKGDAAGRAIVTLKNEVEIPNKDFILRYRLATDEIGDAFLVHQDQRGRFFTLVLQPPQRVVPQQLVPRELIFVLDSSGSMSGFPIEKAKAVIAHLIDTMQPHDTFNLITFSGNTRILWDRPRPNTPQNRAEMQKLLASLDGGGGTEMMKAIDAALRPTSPAEAGSRRAGIAPLRVVCFFTDGYVGNDMAIIDAVKKYAAATRVFSFGIGNSVNRFLLDGMGYAGRGEVEYVTLQGDADAAAERFHERILAPVLADIQIDWGTLPVADVYPKQIPDLFSAKPMMIHGRLTGEPHGTVTLRGNTGAGPYQEAIEVSWPEAPPDHAALPSLWARAKVEDLMMQDYTAAQTGQFPDALRTQVIALGLEYRLMTQFTSFVAVEEMTVTAGGQPVKVQVPVEMPDGVSYEGVFGECEAGAATPRSLAYGGKAAARGAAIVGGVAGVSAPPAPMPSSGRPAKQELKRAGERIVDKDTSGDGLHELGASLAPTTEEIVRTKLAEPLRDLAAKVAQDGQDGNLTIGKLKIVSYRLDVMIFLSDASEKTLATLKELGFVQTAESKTIMLLIGTLDVRKLEDLAKLDAVIRVKPVIEP